MTDLLPIDIEDVHGFGAHPQARAKLEPSSGFLEITLNHPRTDKFKNALSVKQKQILYNGFQSLIKHLGATKYDHVYETCMDGVIHLHGWIEINQEICIPNILINDIVKVWLRGMPKKYSYWDSKSYKHEWLRYRCPSICVQYRDTEKGIEKFKNYMRKNPV